MLWRCCVERRCLLECVESDSAHESFLLSVCLFVSPFECGDIGRTFSLV